MCIFLVVLSVMELYVTGAAKKIILLYMFHYIDQFLCKCVFSEGWGEEFEGGFFILDISFIICIIVGNFIIIGIFGNLEIWKFYYFWNFWNFWNFWKFWKFWKFYYYWKFYYFWIVITIYIFILLLRERSLCEIHQRVLRR